MPHQIGLRDRSPLGPLEVEVDERPRERLLRGGPVGLSDGELVSVMLRTGVRGRQVLDLAHDLLRGLGGLRGLAVASSSSFERYRLGPVKVATLLAAVEIGRRLARAEIPRRDPMSHPAAVANYLRLRYCRGEQEVMGALYLDSRNHLLSEAEIFTGTLSRAAVEPRAILKQAILGDAAGVILFHTHPSGDPTPSAEDIAFTRRLREAGDILGVRLIDHLILGNGGRWTSLERLGECS